MPDAVVLQRALGLRLRPRALELALTHRSYAFEAGGVPTNERLEFLGDAVLGLAVTDLLFRRYPDLDEGELAKRRAALVSTRTLALVAERVGLGEHVRLGHGESRTGGRGKPSILADAMEAVIGAVYLEEGMPAATALVHRLLQPVLDSPELRRRTHDWKTVLQEAAAARHAGVPTYRVQGAGPDHERRYVAVVTLDEDAGRGVRGVGEGHSKKEAEQLAAEQAVHALLAAFEACTEVDGRTAAADGRGDGQPAAALRPGPLDAGPRAGGSAG
jgi:ribonuclease-3